MYNFVKIDKNLLEKKKINENKYVIKDKNTLVIGSEGCGYEYYNCFLNYIFTLYNPNIKIVFSNTNDADIIVCSHYFPNHNNTKWNTKKKNYIFVDSEGMTCYNIDKVYKLRNNLVNKYLIYTTNADDLKPLKYHIPYGFVDYIKIKNLNLWNNSKFLSIKDRKFFLAYCIRNTTFNVSTKKNEFLNLLCNISKETYALGNFCHKKSIHKKLKLPYNGDATHSNFLNKNTNLATQELILTFTQFKFILTAENTDRYGYMSEKIINALASGAIPIYIGNSDYIKKVINPKRMINVNDFSSHIDCIKYIFSLKDSDFDRYQNEEIFTNEKESEIFRELYNKNSKENVNLINQVKYIIGK